MTSSPSAKRKELVTWGGIIFVVGLVVRLILALPVGEIKVLENGPEPVKVAFSLMTTGRFADAYGTGSGPTAHCAPAYPILLSVLFRAFGLGRVGATAVLVLASAAASAGFAFLPALAAAGGIAPWIGILAGLAGALLPINFWAQTSGVFEAPITALVLTTLCILACRIWAADQFRISEAAIFGIVAGFGCLVGPSLIPVLAAWSVMLAVGHRRNLRRVLPFLAVAIALVFAMLMPWAIRNYRVLGALIWTRSDFGLELQVSNNDLMTPDAEVNVSLPDFALFHPTAGAAELAKVRRLGEVEYGHAKERQALTWIASHRRRFLSLTLERFRLFWFPHMKRPSQSALEAVLTLLAFGGFARLCRQKSMIVWVFIPVFIAYPAVYYIIQASGRYRFPIEPLLYLLAASLFASPGLPPGGPARRFRLISFRSAAVRANGGSV